MIIIETNIAEFKAKLTMANTIRLMSIGPLKYWIYICLDRHSRTAVKFLGPLKHGDFDILRLFLDAFIWLQTSLLAVKYYDRYVAMITQFK